MVLFIILLITLATLVVFLVIGAGLGGAIFIILFSDVLVCVFLIAWLIRRLNRKK